MKLYIASDHQGHKLQESIIKSLPEYEFITSTVVESPTDDYPLFAFDVCNKMNKDEDFATLICGNGIGISIAANKVKGVRCARVTTEEDVSLAKQHNHANAISFGANTSLDDAITYIKILLNTKVDNAERHARRVNEIINYENGAYNGL